MPLRRVRVGAEGRPRLRVGGGAAARPAAPGARGGGAAAASEVEVAAAALELTDPCADLADARRFAAAYRDAGGTAASLDELTLVQLMRHRLRRESAYVALATAHGVAHDHEDLAYQHRRLETFARLRP